MTDEFGVVLDSIGSSDEIKFLKTNIKDTKKQQEIIEFIKENKIDCHHLWEDSEEGDKSTRDWHKLAAFIFDIDL